MSSMIPELLERYGFQPSHVYLLELVPIIEIMWADGRNQAAEVDIVRHITQRLVKNINSNAHGITVLSQQDVDSFLNKLTTTRPAPALLKALRELTVDHLKEKGITPNHAKSIIEYCLDVASACVGSYPYNFGERIMDTEKKLIWELVEQLDLNPAQMI